MLIHETWKLLCCLTSEPTIRTPSSESQLDILSNYFSLKQEFNYGVEFVLLISVTEDALGKPVEDAMANLASLTRKFEPLIVQATQGFFLKKIKIKKRCCALPLPTIFT